MIKRNAFYILLFLAAVGAIGLPIGCGPNSPLSGDGNSLNFEALMTCPGAQKPTDGNLEWGAFTMTPIGTTEPRPGDQISVSMMVLNTPPAGTPVTSNANITFSSNIRIWFSFDSTLGPEDYLVGEFVQPGLYANNAIFIVDNFQVPHPTSPPDFVGADATTTQEIMQPNGDPYAPQRYYRYQDFFFPTIIPDTSGIADPDHDYNPAHPSYHPEEPDEAYPEYVGPQSITYTVIAVLDASNCVLESASATPEPTTPVHEHQALAGATDNIFSNAGTLPTIQIWNPNLPNLQIKFLDRQPATPVPQRGATIVTQWEILNAGIGPVNADQAFGVRVYYSENDWIDSWDRNIVVRNPDADPIALGPDGAGRENASNDDCWVVNGPIFGNSNRAEFVQCRTPYQKVGMNVYAGWYSSLAAWAGVDDTTSRDPPPTNPPAWIFTVYNPIPSNGQGTNMLIGQVDGTNAIREAVEIDNYSNQGSGQSGTVDISAVNGGPYNMHPTDLVCDMQQGVLYMQLTYESTLPAATYQSVGWYLSANDTAQSSDSFLERFWYTILAGQNNILDTQFAPPYSEPAAGPYHVIAVMDDIFKEVETWEDDNFLLAVNTIDYQ